MSTTPPGGPDPGHGQNPYGQSPYGQNPYGQNPYGQPAYGSPPAHPPVPPGYELASRGLDPWGRPLLRYASWWSRVAATLVDTVLYFVAIIPLAIGIILATPSTREDPLTGALVETAPAPDPELGFTLILIGLPLYFGLVLWNACYRQGVTGASVGKQVLGIRVMREADGQPQGFWASLGRLFLHGIVDGWCYLGYLWPIWDSKKQTFTDKIMSTVVVASR